MRDFRPRVVQRRPSQSEIAEILRKGQLKKALRKARVAGFVIAQEDIDATAKAMYRSGRAGELLATIGTLDIKLPYDTTTLLIGAFDAGDYHNFLKHVHRLEMSPQHGKRIKVAIARIKQNAPREADSWYRKLCTS